jgi:iron complex transport system substrate-binding protein
MNDLIVLAGGTPYAGPINIDEIKRFDPQMIVIAIPGDESEFDPTLIAARDGWSDLTAVRNERVFAIDDALLLRPGPRIVQGVKQLAKILHGITVNGN